MGNRGNFHKRGKKKALDRGAISRPVSLGRREVTISRGDFEALQVGSAVLRKEQAELLATTAMRMHGSRAAHAAVHAVALGAGAALLALEAALEGAFVPDKKNPPEWYRAMHDLIHPPAPEPKTGPIGSRDELLRRAAESDIQIVGG